MGDIRQSANTERCNWWLIRIGLMSWPEGGVELNSHLVPISVWYRLYELKVDEYRKTKTKTKKMTYLTFPERWTFVRAGQANAWNVSYVIFLRCSTYPHQPSVHTIPPLFYSLHRRRPTLVLTGVSILVFDVAASDLPQFVDKLKTFGSYTPRMNIPEKKFCI